MTTAGSPLLGDLETAVMEWLWAHGPASVKDVHGSLGRRRRIVLNTVQSTMERLFRKGLLGRRKVSHAYIYAPRVDRDELRARILGELVDRVVGADRVLAVSTFVDLAARAGDDVLERLERLVAERRARAEPPPEGDAEPGGDPS